MVSVAAISTQSLTHTFPAARGRGAVHALRDVSFAVAPGTLSGLFGPNGAGKSTLIRILATLIIPTGGTAQVLGYDVRRAPAQVRASIGLVSSNENSFYGRLSGQRNLEFFAALQNLDLATARQRAARLLEMFELQTAAGRPFQSYSTGMRQKLNIIRALLHNPPVLFLDEPTKGMDIATSERVHRLLRQELVERQGKTILLTTHDLDEMETLCDQVAILEQGALRAVGAPADLIKQASASVVYRLELVGEAAPVVPQLQQLSLVRSVTIVSQTAGATVLELTLNRPHAPGAELWQIFTQHNLRIKRYGPKDDGLRQLLKANDADDGHIPGTPLQ